MKLTTNEEKVRKKLEKFPNGVKATQLTRELYMSNSTLYETLNRLETKELAFRGEHSLWYPEEPSRLTKPKMGWFEKRALRKRLERERRVNLLSRKGAAAEEKCELDEDADVVNKENEIDRKYRLL